MAADLTGAALLSRTRQERDFPLPDKPDIGIGYDRSNDLAIAFDGISRRHARITYDGKDYWIEDVGSTNGTYLNAIRLKTRERLKHLDIVGLGRRADLIFIRRSVDLSRKTRRGILEARLEIMDGLEAGTSRKIPRGSVTIGRSPSNNIVADSQLVSKVHARLERSGVELLLTDLHSANGTLVNGEPLIDSRILKDGDEIRVGHSRSYRVRIEEGDVLTRDVPMPRTTTSSENRSLPYSWKTGMEWSPEEAAVFDRALTELAADAPQTKGSKPGKTAIAPRPERPEHPAPRPPEAATPEPKAEAVTLPPEPKAPAPATPPGPGPDVTTRALAPSETVAARLLLESEDRTIPVSIGTHVIGRLSECDIRLEGPAISRRHATLRVSETEAILEDNQTANGTYVNKERLAAPRSLANGDVVAFGTTAFRVRMAPAKPAMPPAKPG